MKGAVTDESPGALAASNGAIGVNTGPVPTTVVSTPAVSDENMSAWMQYLYMQQPMPMNVKGVEVSLDALDPNGNFVHLGTVTSDASGNYMLTFTPETPGDYTVIASFAGSNSYGSSSAETAIVVSESAPTAAPTSAAPQSVVDMYFVPAIAGIIAAIIIGFAFIALMLKKRP